MFKLRRILVLLLIGLTLSSCLKLDEELFIKKDGSAVLTLHYSVPQKYEKLLGNMEVVLRGTKNTVSKKRLPQARYFDRQSCEKYLKKFKGAKLLSHRSYRFEERLHCFVKISFDDFSKALKQGFFPSRTFKINEETGISEYRIPLNIPQKSQFKTLLKESSVSLKVTIEGKFEGSNAIPKHNTMKSTQWLYDENQKNTLLDAPKELWFKFTLDKPKPVIEETNEDLDEKDKKDDVHFIDLTE